MSSVHVTDAVDAVLRAFHERLWSGYWPPERALVDAGYATLPFPFALVNAEGVAALEDFHSSMARAWGDPKVARVARLPIALRAGRIHRP